MSHQAAETAVIYPGTVIGEGCVIGDHAVLGKQPALFRIQLQSLTAYLVECARHG